jgi:hypothetical protein
LEKILVKIKNFANSKKNKFGYVYVLTAISIIEKAAITQRSLERKIKEYKDLQDDTKALRSEVYR